MKFTSAEALEWGQVRALIGRYIGSPMGAAELAKLEPGDDLERLQPDLAEAGEAILYIRASATPHSAQAAGSFVRDIPEAVRSASISTACRTSR